MSFRERAHAAFAAKSPTDPQIHFPLADEKNVSGARNSLVIVVTTLNRGPRLEAKEATVFSQRALWREEVIVGESLMRQIAKIVT